MHLLREQIKPDLSQNRPGLTTERPPRPFTPKGADEHGLHRTFLPILLTVASLLLASTAAWADIPGELQPPEGSNSAEGLFFGLLLGIILAACCYLFFIWTVFRDLSQAILIIMLVFLGAHMTLANPVTASMLSLGDTATREYLQNFAMIMFYLASVVFTLRFLEIGTHVAGMQMPLLGLILLLVGVLVFASIFDHRLIVFLLPGVGILTTGALLVTGLFALYREVPGSTIHLLAFAIYLAGGMSEPLRDLGLIRGVFDADSLMYITSGTSAIAFAVVISGQFTARQEAKEKELARSNERFALAAMGANEGLYDWNLAAGTVYFSDRLKQIVGLRLKNSPAGIKTLLRMIHGSDRRRLLTAMRDFRRSSRQTVSFECRLLRPDRRKRWIYATGLAMRDPQSGKMTRLVGSLGDITPKKAGDAEIAKQKEALQQSEKMAALGGLLAGVAHELNNPLSVIVGQAALLGEGSQDPKVVGRAEKISRAAERCSRIVKSFLAIARRKPPERRPMQINEVVNTALELLAYQVRTENIQLDLHLDPALPALIGDADQMTQVATNLVINAVQAMQGWRGTRRIVVRSFTAPTEGRLHLTVSDSGPGIPEAIRKRVFEPFFTTKSPGSGTGVGLSLCLNIVESHGGELVLTDTPGGGATFDIALPYVAGPSTSTQGKTVASVPGDRPQALSILLVDDETELAHTLADMLQPDGHSFDFAVNGQAALDKIAAKPYDVIISDLRMPVLDGPGMYEALRTTYPAYTDRVIFVTGDTLTTHVKDFLGEYPVPCVEKPYTLADIRQAIARLLHRPETETIPIAHRKPVESVPLPLQGQTQAVKG